MITKPMLASPCRDLSNLDFKNNIYLATPKLDGIRALIINGKLVSRSFKPIRNEHVFNILQEILPNNSDGEIVCVRNRSDSPIEPLSFQETSSGVMSKKGTPLFMFFWFDLVSKNLNDPYQVRIDEMMETYESLTLEQQEYILPLYPQRVNSVEELKILEAVYLNEGYEGLILRTSSSPYKCGRATESEQWLLKIKQFEDGEAVIVGIGEKMHNANEAKLDNFGRTKRSTSKNNLIPSGTMGKLFVKDIVTNIEFEIGSGFNDNLRDEIWANKEKWIGKIVKYKHFANSGVKDKPRFPVFLGERDKDDL